MSQRTIDLRLDGVSKRYRLNSDTRDAQTGLSPGSILRRLFGRSEEFWAVRDVSFEVERGEALGIIGRNGAGKSTILKLISRITAPTKGEIAVNGRVCSLVEVGSGFHPQLTGRENIFLNGCILGMSKREIAAKFDSIVEFAGVERFIDTPVKRYSSGMYVRLGFSVAAHLEPDVLLLDEVLAVGDSAFQWKCMQRVRELKEAGTTIVYISHNLSSVEYVCDRVLLMEQGSVMLSGTPREVVAEYDRLVTDLSQRLSRPAGGAARTGPAEISGCTLRDPQGRQAAIFSVAEPFALEVAYEAHERVEDVVFQASFYSAAGSLRCRFTTERSDEQIDLEPGAGVVEFFCSEMCLLPGTYGVEVAIRKRDSKPHEAIDRKVAAVLNVGHGYRLPGQFYMPHRWAVNRRESSEHCDTLRQ
jgi:ABC-type polysaccharide/polyol phosphate transport system ATPase subunit